MRLARLSTAALLTLVACKEPPPPPPPPPVVEVKVEPPKAPIEPPTLAAMEAWMKLENRKNLPLDPLTKVVDQLQVAPVPNDPKYAGQHALAKWKAIAKTIAVATEIRAAAAPAAAEGEAVVPAEGEGEAAAPAAAPAPFDPKFQEFAKKYVALVSYNAPADLYFLNAPEVWKDATTHGESSSADDLAWLAADTLLAGECQGSAPCYLERCVQTAGEYLKRQPKGAHLAEALAMVRSSMPEAEDESIPTLNRADLFRATDALESLLSVTGKVTHAEAAETLVAIRATMARLAEVKPK